MTPSHWCLGVNDSPNILPWHEWLRPDVNDSLEFLTPSLKLCSGVTLCMPFITLLPFWTQASGVLVLSFQSLKNDADMGESIPPWGSHCHLRHKCSGSHSRQGVIHASDTGSPDFTRPYQFYTIHTTSSPLPSTPAHDSLSLYRPCHLFLGLFLLKSYEKEMEATSAL